MTRNTKRVLIGSALVVGLFVAFVIEERVRGHVALEAWRRALRAQGEKLTIAELAPAVTNPAVLVRTPSQLQAMLVPAFVGMEPVSPPARPVGKDVVLWQCSVWRQGTSTNRSADGWATFAESFARTREQLARFRAEFTNRTVVVHLDFEAGYTVLLPHLATVKGTAQALRLGTLLALHEGRLEEAWDNLMTGVALAELQRDEPLIISQLVRLACAEISLGGLWQALQADGWTDAQLEAIQQSWSQVRFLPAMGQAFAMERAMAASYFQGKRGGLAELSQAFGFSDGFPAVAFEPGDLGGLDAWLGPVLEKGAELRRLAFLALWWAAWAEQDQLFHHRRIQETLEAVRAAVRQRDTRKLRPGPEGPESVAFLGAGGSPTEAMGLFGRLKHWMSLMLVQTLDRYVGNAIQTECRRELSVAALALERYRLRHGEWPPSLEALVPGFMAELPRDWINGEPLRYRVNADGTFTLYSVGWDGQDDGGDATPREGTRRTLYQGRDWVWPQPATEEEIAAAERETLSSRRR